ncbi:cleavage induced protein [Achlya hypogyna]|uniref:Cleavage induced protein n=1 Tax=Achlya hypogyna TaxID=1202772 RepID=A0A1V9YYD5_ACHHY|nr:cleavage induced protein [Achlya hypogyna]
MPQHLPWLLPSQEGAPPIYYGVFGNGISHVVGRESPMSLNPSRSADAEPFFAYEWVDDHIMIELESADRLVAAETCLRLTMLLTLGPHAINDQRFTAWSVQLHALGLDWDLERGTDFMPQDKIRKALGRIRLLLGSTRTTRLELQRLLGSLRHVSSCLPAARAFLQTLHLVMVTAHKWSAFYITRSMLAVPVGLFATVPSHDLVVWVDASDDGLAAVDPVNRQFILLTFDEAERSLVAQSRNLPELLKRPALRYARTTPHTPLVDRTFYITVFCDNQAGVAWSSCLSSPNAYGQELARCLGLHQALFRFHVTTKHIAGVRNEIADSGSRPYDPALARLWSAVTAGSAETTVPNELRHVYSTFSTVYAPMHWPKAP